MRALKKHICASPCRNCFRRDGEFLAKPFQFLFHRCKRFAQSLLQKILTIFSSTSHSAFLFTVITDRRIAIRSVRWLLNKTSLLQTRVVVDINILFFDSQHVAWKKLNHILRLIVNKVAIPESVSVISLLFLSLTADNCKDDYSYYCTVTFNLELDCYVMHCTVL